MIYLGVSLFSLVCCCAASNKLLLLFKSLKSKSQCLSLSRCVNKSGTMIKFLPLFLVYHIDFHERIKMPFTICKYLH